MKHTLIVWLLRFNVGSRIQDGGKWWMSKTSKIYCVEWYPTHLLHDWTMPCSTNASCQWQASCWTIAPVRSQNLRTEQLKPYAPTNEFPRTYIRQLGVQKDWEYQRVVYFVVMLLLSSCEQWINNNNSNGKLTIRLGLREQMTSVGTVDVQRDVYSWPSWVFGA